MKRTLIIEVVCTDKGQHSLTTLGDLTFRPHHQLRPNRIPLRGVAAKLTYECVQMDHLGRVNMHCNRCERNPQLTPDNVEKLRAAGIAQLDISLLPF
jgi:hypothetical protein